MPDHKPRKRIVKDRTLVEAVDVARASAVETGGEESVGEHLRCDAEAERVCTHYFACLKPGYVGWHWAVTLTRAPRSKTITVNECVLLPNSGAMLAPEWVPWEERVKPDDLGPGDLLPIEPAADPRLVPGYTHGGDSPELVDELGLGREWVLARAARAAAAKRWHEGETGPDTQISRAAPARCRTCAFALPLSGSLGHSFGVCANDSTPFDGKVVDYDHGCGGHSDVRTPLTADEPEPIVDTLTYDPVVPD